MKKLSAGVWGGLSVVAVGVLFFAYSLMLPYKSEIGPGPGFFPIWLSGLLILLGATYLYQSWKGNDSANDKPSREGAKNIVFILVCMILFVLLLRTLGFMVCGAAFLFALLFRSYKWFVNLAISVGTSVFLYVLFSILLGVQLPVNALGF